MPEAIRTTLRLETIFFVVVTMYIIVSFFSCASQSKNATETAFWIYRVIEGSAEE
jgi:hypothetical protein